MPDIGHAVVVNATLTPAAITATEWGIPALVGVSTAEAKNTPTLYYSAAAVQAAHGAASAIGIAAASLFAQGVTRCYVVSVAMVGDEPTDTEIETALATLTNYATDYLISGVCLAGLTDAASVAKLVTFAEAAGVIFTVTHEPGDAVATITGIATSAASPNGFCVAYNDAATGDDVAAVALGRLMTLKPWVSPFWKPVVTDVADYFAPTDLVTLEAGNVNAFINLSGAVCLSNGLTTEGDPKYIDITRTKFYIARQVQLAVATLRMQMEKIPFTQDGLDYVKGAVASALVTMQRLGAITEYTVTVPRLEAIAEVDMSNRVLRGISISATLAGEIHSFNLDLAVII